MWFLLSLYFQQFFTFFSNYVFILFSIIFLFDFVLLFFLFCLIIVFTFIFLLDHKGILDLTKVKLGQGNIIVNYCYMKWGYCVE